jgi:hypothetical protein
VGLVAFLFLAVCLSGIYLFALGAPWRTAVVVLVSLGLLVGALGLVATLITTALADEPCYEGPCSEHVPLFLVAYVEALLAAAIVAVAVAALAVRGVRAVRSNR